MAANFQNCDINRLMSDAKQFMDTSGVFENDREAIAVYLFVLGLKAAGGADYTVPNGFESLLHDAAGWIAVPRVISADDRQALALQMDLENVITDGGNPPTDMPTLRLNSKKALGLPKETRRNLLMFLKCQINKAGKPE